MKMMKTEKMKLITFTIIAKKNYTNETKAQIMNKLD